MWTCKKCNEESEDNFDSCWKCQTESDIELKKSKIYHKELKEENIILFPMSGMEKEQYAWLYTWPIGVIVLLFFFSFFFIPYYVDYVLGYFIFTKFGGMRLSAIIWVVLIVLPVFILKVIAVMLHGKGNLSLEKPKKVLPP